MTPIECLRTRKSYLERASVSDSGYGEVHGSKSKLEEEQKSDKNFANPKHFL